MLTPAQVTFFQENGYLILENFIDSDIIEGWRGQVWKHLNSKLDTPETWPNNYVVENFSFSPLFGQLPAMQEITEQLGGGAFTGGGGSPLVKWPNPDENWTMPRIGHIDAYGAAGWSPFMLGATTYLYDVKPGGGAFIYWPRSHHTTHQYFLQYPEQIDGSFRNVEGWDWNVLSGFIAGTSARIHQCSRRRGAVARVSMSHRFRERKGYPTFRPVCALCPQTTGAD